MVMRVRRRQPINDCDEQDESSTKILQQDGDDDASMMILRLDIFKYWVKKGIIPKTIMDQEPKEEMILKFSVERW